MALHPLAEHFAAVAGAYERGRPDYPPAVVDVLARELRLARGERLLDVAAGTGKLTRALAAAGLAVDAVEPLEPLRAVLGRFLAPERVHGGVAEALPFGDATFRAVTVADAFHWFDQARALAEIRRVLGPAGRLALIATLLDWSAAPWGEELESLLVGQRSAHPYFDGAPWQETLAAAPGWGLPWEVAVSTRQELDPARIVDYVRSMSWVAALDERDRHPLVSRVRALVAHGTPHDLPVRAVTWLCERA